LSPYLARLGVRTRSRPRVIRRAQLRRWNRGEYRILRRRKAAIARAVPSVIYVRIVSRRHRSHRPSRLRASSRRRVVATLRRNASSRTSPVAARGSVLARSPPSSSRTTATEIPSLAARAGGRRIASRRRLAARTRRVAVAAN